MNYSENNTYLSNYAGDIGYQTDPDFQTQLPAFIRAGELRIFRDMDMQATYVTDTTAALTANSREFVLPSGSGKFQAVATVAIQMGYDPLVLTGTLFTQPPLQWVSKEFLDAVYPDPHAVGAPSIPTYVAPVTDDILAVGPAPGVAYPLVIYGEVYPATLTAVNAETYLSVNLPDLFLASEMINVSLWVRQFGTQADEPQMSVDWTKVYKDLLAAADVVEARSSIMGAGYGIHGPNPVAKAV